MDLGKSVTSTRDGRNYPRPILEHANRYSGDLQLPYSDYSRGFSSHEGKYLNPEDYSASWGYDSTSREYQRNDYSSFTSPGNPGKLYPSGGYAQSYASEGDTGSTLDGSYTSGSRSYAPTSNTGRVHVLTLPSSAHGSQVRLAVGHMVMWQIDRATRR